MTRSGYRRRPPIRGLLCLLAVLAVCIVPVAATASNHTTCAATEFCIYGAPNYTGDRYAPNVQDIPDWPCGTLCSPDVDENEDSVKNQYVLGLRVYDFASYGGSVRYCMNAGEVEDDIAADRDRGGHSSKYFSGTLCGIGENHP